LVAFPPAASPWSRASTREGLQSAIRLPSRRDARMSPRRVAAAQTRQRRRTVHASLNSSNPLA
jgi:hypothetical protein